MTLRIQNLNVSYGPVPALQDATISVESGKCVVVIGANGSGKTSLLRAISGLARDVEGSIEFDQNIIVRKGLGLRRINQRHLVAEKIVRLGIRLVPDGRQLFGRMTVFENLFAGGYLLEQRKIQHRVDVVLSYFPILKKKLRDKAGSLSGGEQQMLAIGRALMVPPKLLMLDEPTVGLAPKIVEEVFLFLRQLRDQRICSILLVEQNARAALSIADYCYVLEAPGHIAAEGETHIIENMDVVRRAYLGD